MDEKTGLTWIIGDNGFINYSRSSDDTNYLDGEEDIEKTIFVNRPYQDEEVALKDGKIMLSEAISMAQKEEENGKNCLATEQCAGEKGRNSPWQQTVEKKRH